MEVDISEFLPAALFDSLNTIFRHIARESAWSANSDEAIPCASFKSEDRFFCASHEYALAELNWVFHF
ncbi:hypothetical protein AXZ77_0704 [Thioclava sp. ES.031]|nr:hypothetical protein AXZ77_0704 [Thioclava sp. ES.031]